MSHILILEKNPAAAAIINEAENFNEYAKLDLTFAMIRTAIMNFNNAFYAKACLIRDLALLIILILKQSLYGKNTFLLKLQVGHFVIDITAIIFSYTGMFVPKLSSFGIKAVIAIVKISISSNSIKELSVNCITCLTNKIGEAKSTMRKEKLLFFVK